MPGPDPSPAAIEMGLLDRLRAAGGDYVSIDELASGLAWERVRVLAGLDAMSAFGFAIERHPYRGAAYRGPSSRLCPDQIEHALGTIRIGRRIAVWDRVVSTNDLAASASGSPSNEGLVILAEEQAAGRGRLGRTWASPARSSILMSVLLFPPRSSPTGAPDDVAWLTAVAAVAVAEVVADRVGRASAIKWPNDVRVDGRKIAGILVERPASALGSAAVLGIGLNVNLKRDDFPEDLRDRATSIQIERSGEPDDRSEIARDLIRRLDWWYEIVVREGPDELVPSWRDRSEHLGQFVRVETPEGSKHGRLVDLDFRTGLVLEPSGGEPWMRLAPAEVLAVGSTEGDGGLWTSEPSGG